MNSLQTLMVASVLFCFVGIASAEDAGKLEDALAEPITLKFDQQSLEFSLKSLAEQVGKQHEGFKIKIVGDDLAQEGITRNQTIRNYEATDKPAAEILTELVMRANPIRDLSGPSDPNLKLVWIVAADPDNVAKLAILITTRAAVEKRGDKLPKVFHLKE